MKVSALGNKKIVAISCGETHTLCLTDGGHLYSFGGNTCGQLGQYQQPKDPKKQRKSIEEIVFPKQNSDSHQYSFMSSSNDSPPDTPHDQ